MMYMLVIKEAAITPIDLGKKEAARNLRRSFDTPQWQMQVSRKTTPRNCSAVDQVIDIGRDKGFSFQYFQV